MPAELGLHRSARGLAVLQFADRVAQGFRQLFRAHAGEHLGLLGLVLPFVVNLREGFSGEDLAAGLERIVFVGEPQLAEVVFDLARARDLCGVFGLERIIAQRRLLLQFDHRRIGQRRQARDLHVRSKLWLGEQIVAPGLLGQQHVIGEHAQHLFALLGLAQIRAMRACNGFEQRLGYGDAVDRFGDGLARARLDQLDRSSRSRGCSSWQSG